MTKKIAINGFGRIGKCAARAILEQQNLSLVAINSNKLIPQNAAHMLQYDSIHGRINEVFCDENFIMYDNHKVRILNHSSIENINWSEYDIDIVLECTGAFNKKEQAYTHIKNGAKTVIVSAPCENADDTIILGVNSIPKNFFKQVISIGSCTTNCLANIVKPLHDAFEITSAFMTTVHAYTNDQCLLDSRHSDLRRGRAAESSIIPTSTGAARVIGNIIPELKGKIDGVAVRVPVQNVSMVDIKFTTQIQASEQEINTVMKIVAEKIPHILSINDKPLVSIDFNHTIQSAIFDITQTKIVGNIYRIVAWYDNEWGFTNRMINLCNILSL